ncbi:MAG TPA: ATP-binding protein, partial [Paracoccaceae bacterium]|nr:ATP-binding protein [Paracoccaceae bacterium]
SRLFEPYVTTREKGTGLGLPIVRKIVEDHAGHIELLDGPPEAASGHRGAEIRILLPLAGPAAKTQKTQERASRTA